MQSKQVFCPDFLIIPYTIVADKSLKPLDRIVYGVVYWFHSMKEGSCYAGNKTIAEYASGSVRGVQNSLTTLEKYGYVRRIMHDGKNRQIIPLVTYKDAKSARSSKEVSSNEDSKGADPMTSLSSNEEKISNSNKENKQEDIAPPSEDAETTKEKAWTQSELSAYLDEMLNGSRTGVRVIALYWGYKGVGVDRGAIQLGSKAQAEFALRRALRPANRLAKAFPYPKIEEKMGIFAEHANFDWTLETVEKYITRSNDDLVKMLRDMSRRK